MRKTAMTLACVALLGISCQQSEPAPEPAGRAVLQLGDRAPGFTLASPETEVSLEAYRGKKAVLLYFSMGPG